MTRKEAEKKRRDFIDDNQQSLFKRLRSLQNQLYNSIASIIAELDTDKNGKVKITVANRKRQQRITRIVKAFENSKIVQLGKWIGKRALNLFGLNKSYFDEVKEHSDSIDDRVRKRLLIQLGYDSEKDEILEDGYLSTLTKESGIAKKVAQLINNAFRGRQDLGTFKKVFKQEMVGNNGVVEKRILDGARTLFAEQDRLIQREYANDLGLTYFIYAHTKSKNTRPFCCQRLNGLYTIEFAEKWNDLDWKGKIDNVDFFAQQGGFNCRGTMNYIDSEFAELLIKRGRKLNVLLPLKQAA